MVAGIKRFVFVFVLAVASFGTYAQTTKVVVIPMFGDNAAERWRGPWTIGVEYEKGDIVEEGGSSYIALSDHTADGINVPPAAGLWDLVAASGTNGIDGNDGDKGATGTAATLDVGTITTGVAGSNATVINSGTTSAAKFDFTIPRGDKGDTGDTGPPGLIDQVTLDFMLNSIELGTIKRIVFTTSTSYDGNLVAAAHSLGLTNVTGGLQAGNALCSYHAFYVGLPGWENYRAWLSTSTESPATTFAQSLGSYVRTDGITIANNWDDLVDRTLTNPINLTEYGVLYNGAVLTGTSPYGELVDPLFTCDDWTTNSASFSYLYGGASHTSSNWTVLPVPPLSCDTPSRLYCFQQ